MKAHNQRYQRIFKSPVQKKIMTAMFNWPIRGFVTKNTPWKTTRSTDVTDELVSTLLCRFLRNYRYLFLINLPYCCCILCILYVWVVYYNYVWFFLSLFNTN